MLMRSSVLLIVYSNMPQINVQTVVIICPFSIYIDYSLAMELLYFCACIDRA